MLYLLHLGVPLEDVDQQKKKVFFLENTCAFRAHTSDIKKDTIFFGVRDPPAIL